LTYIGKGCNILLSIVKGEMKMNEKLKDALEKLTEFKKVNPEVVTVFLVSEMKYEKTIRKIIQDCNLTKPDLIKSRYDKELLSMKISPWSFKFFGIGC
jgi:hypothetical protein